jgi:hypothetical protein
VKKNTAKKNEVPVDHNAKSNQAIQRQLKLVAGKLSELDQLSSELRTLVADTQSALRPPQKAKSSVTGRPEKTETQVTVNELQALRERRSKKLKAGVDAEKKAAPVKAVPAAKAQSKAFSVSRPAQPAKKKKPA